MTPELLPLASLIEDGRVHVLDGAMGTLVYDRGIFVNVCYDELNVTEPTLIEGVHRDYVAAGAEIIETNTFGANPMKLSSFGLAEDTEAINAAAVGLARNAANGRALVVGAIGPLGIRIEPFGPTSRAEAQAYYARQVAGLVEGGVDGFVLETFSDLNELHTAFEAVRAQSELPVFCLITIGQDGRTAYGTAPDAVAAQATDWGADVIGVNCSVGPAVLLDAVEQMARVTDRPLCAQPNAGLPREVGGRKIYLASPDYMAQYAARMIDAGVRFLGGCCGTTPEHVKRIVESVSAVQPRIHAVEIRPQGREDGSGLADEVPLDERSQWGRKLAAGEFLTSVELIPPKGWSPEGMLHTAQTIRDAGVDCVNVTDGPRAQAHMGVLPAALLVHREVGIEPIVHYTCRDRNMLSMLSDLLGAAAGGIRNVLIVTGDPPALGPYPDATAVFDIDSIGLTNLVQGLNRGVDPGGSRIGDPTRYVIGVVANQAAVDLEREATRYMWKIEAGADYVLTQPIFEAGHLECFLERTAEWQRPTIAHLRPFTSLRDAEFLANEVPGVHVPPSVLRRMELAQEGGRESAENMGIEIAVEAFEAVRGLVQGVHVATPRGRTEAALEVLQRIGASREGG